MECLVSQLEDVGFEDLLILFVVRVLIQQGAIDIDLELGRFDASHHSVGVVADIELNLDHTSLAIDTIDQLGLVDCSMRLAKQGKGYGIQQGRLTRTILTDDQCVFMLV